MVDPLTFKPLFIDTSDATRRPLLRLVSFVITNPDNPVISPCRVVVPAVYNLPFNDVSSITNILPFRDRSSATIRV